MRAGCAVGNAVTDLASSVPSRATNLRKCDLVSTAQTLDAPKRKRNCAEGSDTLQKSQSKMPKRDQLRACFCTLNSANPGAPRAQEMLICAETSIGDTSAHDHVPRENVQVIAWLTASVIHGTDTKQLLQAACHEHMKPLL